VILAIPEGLSEPPSIRFSLSLSLSPSFDFLDNPLIQHRPSCVTHKSGFFLVAGLNLLLIFDAMIYYWFSWFLFGWQEEESEEGWVRHIGEGENVCVCGLRVKL
jgi:hypothetical protein